MDKKEELEITYTALKSRNERLNLENEKLRKRLLELKCRLFQ